MSKQLKLIPLKIFYAYLLADEQRFADEIHEKMDWPKINSLVQAHGLRHSVTSQEVRKQLKVIRSTPEHHEQVKKYKTMSPSIKSRISDFLATWLIRSK